MGLEIEGVLYDRAGGQELPSRSPGLELSLLSLLSRPAAGLNVHCERRRSQARGQGRGGSFCGPERCSQDDRVND
jgi:hypothetical protein